jgi:hypothetical protein
MKSVILSEAQHQFFAQAMLTAEDGNRFPFSWRRNGTSFCDRPHSESLQRFVMLSEAKHLLSYASFLPVDPVQQVASALHWRHGRHRSPNTGAHDVNPVFSRNYRVHRLVYYETFK